MEAKSYRGLQINKLDLGRNDPCFCGSGKKYKKCHSDEMTQMQKPSKGVLVKAFDIGTNDPFVARIMLQVLNIRDVIIPAGSEDRKIFDQEYDPVLKNLLEAKIVKERCVQTIKEHDKKVRDGVIAKQVNGVIQVDESRDSDINIWFKDFFIRGEMAINGLILFIKYLGHDISFIQQKDASFDRGCNKFLETYKDARFVKMLMDDRTSWYSHFNILRNLIEHEGYQLPETKYALVKENIIPIFPFFQSMSIPTFFNLLWGNLFRFSEELIIYFLNKKLPKPFVIMVVPNDKRNPTNPIKYIATVPGAGL